jgi:hypothetical protein
LLQSFRDRRATKSKLQGYVGRGYCIGSKPDLFRNISMNQIPCSVRQLLVELKHEQEYIKRMLSICIHARGGRVIDTSRYSFIEYVPLVSNYLDLLQ